jgi:hypothetical protein
MSPIKFAVIFTIIAILLIGMSKLPKEDKRVLGEAMSTGCTTYFLVRGITGK